MYPERYSDVMARREHEPRLAGRSIRDMSRDELRRHLDSTLPERVERAIRRELRSRVSP